MPPTDRSLLLVEAQCQSSPHNSVLVRFSWLTFVKKVLGFTRALAYVGAPHQINVNMIAPYFSATPLLSPLLDFLDGHPLAKTEDVRDVMLSASVEQKVRGAVYLVDPSGIFRSTAKLSPMELPQLKL